MFIITNYGVPHNRFQSFGTAEEAWSAIGHIVANWNRGWEAPAFGVQEVDELPR